MAETHFAEFVRALGDCRDTRGVLGKEGVVYPPLDDTGYEATPRNAVTFGRMGCDGVHYAVLRSNGKVADDSPVIQIGPMDFSEPYSVLADSFLEYLAIGCGITSAEMDLVFDSQRDGSGSLTDFLKGHFDQSRLWNCKRDRAIDRYLDKLDIRDQQ
jgi:hypothetical protein